MTTQEREDTRPAWDKIAPGYDKTNTPMQMWLGNEGLRRAQLRAGMRFLDVAAGSAPRLHWPPDASSSAALPAAGSKELATAGLKDIKVETITEITEFQSGKELWDWLVWSNPIVEMGMLAA